MRTVQLADFISLRRGASYKGALVGEKGVPLLGLGTIAKHGGFKTSGVRRYDGDAPERMLVRSGDLYVSLKDMTQEAALLGAVARVPSNIAVGRLTQDTIALDVDSDFGIDRDYLYWMLRGPRFRAYCRNLGTGTTNLDLSQNDFLSFEAKLPSLGVQKAAARVLGVLDGKISANRDVMATSDELVRALYGRLPLSTLTLESVASNVRDSIGVEEIAANEAYVGLEHLGRRSLWLDVQGVGADVSSSKSQFVAGDVLFGKLRPYFHKVVLAASGGVCSTDILVVRATKAQDVALVAAVASSDATVAAAVQASNGTKMPRAKWADIATCSIPDPDSSEVQEFRAIATPLMERAVEAVEENRRLAATRDELLPLLMSGKITVKDAEKTVEEVV